MKTAQLVAVVVVVVLNSKSQNLKKNVCDITDDFCLKYFVEAGAMAVRRVAKDDLKRIAKATGAQMLTSLSNLEGTGNTLLAKENFSIKLLD